MTALDELWRQCERRGWRLDLDGSYPDGRHQPGLVVNALTVRDRDRGLLATAVAGVSEAELDGAALDCAHSLAEQGLIAS